MKRIIKKIMGYEAIFEAAPEGGYDVYFPEVSGCVTFGNNLKQTKQAAKEALTLWVKIKKKNPLEKCIIVPNYGDNQIIHAKTLENIIKQSGISEEKFFK